jgi:hypothetical protein
VLRGVVDCEHGWERNSLAGGDNFVSITPARGRPDGTLSRAGGSYESEQTCLGGGLPTRQIDYESLVGGLMARPSKAQIIRFGWLADVRWTVIAA